jgi:hypothetical protein
MTTGDNHKASDSQHRLSDQVSANTVHELVSVLGYDFSSPLLINSAFTCSAPRSVGADPQQIDGK